VRTRSQPGQESIPIPIPTPTPTPIQTMTGLIGHTFLEVVPEGTNLYERPLDRGCQKTLLGYNETSNRDGEGPDDWEDRKGGGKVKEQQERREDAKVWKERVSLKWAVILTTALVGRKRFIE
jgi:hypothetical protein